VENKPTYNHEAHKREQASSRQSKSKTAYRYVEGDIVIITGPYTDRKITDLWKNGTADDRDFLFREFWKKDPIAREILVRCCAK